MENTLTISATKISAFLKDFENYGVTRDEILRYARIIPSILKSPDNRLTSEGVNRIIQAAVKLTNNEDIGLLQGARLSKGFSSILGYILMNCDTLGEAALKYCKYEKIVDETSITDIKIESNFAILSNTTIDNKLLNNRQFSDFKISGMLSYAKLLTGKNIRLNKVCFTHRKPKDISEYQKIFQCPIFFEESMNALVFDYESLKLLITEPNRSLLILFEKNIQEVLQERDGSETYTKKVTRIITKETKGELPKIDLVARKLTISTRGLQIRLKNEGTSYTKLISKVQREMAEKYLKDKNNSTDEIAYALGFSDTSAFHRAFKKWTGITPKEFRNSIL
ncbi:AraC family transcriptional regulator [Clostridium sp. DJ247]|uniref:AraC family transcriptional regulator n=1 Tax=Clostridium sp. DJ247 TaxID=2726188 RepID=UPI00162A7578|nr:AraC family transcriptional regulator [Clostridium sp. DJ247]MBC2579422.1 AraC family transcriptional regulator [Clostridium sp. DJ247]